MEHFPDNFNRQHIENELRANQCKLLFEIKHAFYKKLIENIKLCKSTINFHIGNILWYELKISLVGDILKRFGEITITNKISDEPEISKTISSIEEISGIKFNEIIVIFNKK